MDLTTGSVASPGQAPLAQGDPRPHGRCLANACNDYPGSLVTATVSGSKVTITSKLRGSATDYAVSHSYTWNSSYFGDSAFTVVQSSAAMTGGAN